MASIFNLPQNQPSRMENKQRHSVDEEGRPIPSIERHDSGARWSSDAGANITIGELELSDGTSIYVDKLGFSYDPMRVEYKSESGPPLYTLECWEIGCETWCAGLTPQNCELRGGHEHEVAGNFANNEFVKMDAVAFTPQAFEKMIEKSYSPLTEQIFPSPSLKDIVKEDKAIPSTFTLTTDSEESWRELLSLMKEAKSPEQWEALGVSFLRSEGGYQSVIRTLGQKLQDFEARSIAWEKENFEALLKSIGAS